MMAGMFLLVSFFMGVLILIGAIFAMGVTTMFDPSGYTTTVAAICAIIYLLISIVVLFGAFMCFSGKSWGVALAAGVLALFTLGPFFIGSICGLIGLVLVAVSREEFNGSRSMMGLKGHGGSLKYRPPPTWKR
jgi:hypothetical protein